MLSLVLVIVLSFPGVNHLIKPIEARPAEKVHFEEFVEVEEMGKAALLRNAMNFAAGVQLVSNTSDKVQVQYKEGVVRKAGSFYVYKKGLFTPQIHGEVKYSLQLEVGEEGYRYTYSDFIFQYYEKNRYGRYAPVSGKKKPLEEEKFAGMQEVWEEHKQTTRRHIESHIRALKAHMQQVPPGAHLDATESQREELH